MYSRILLVVMVSGGSNYDSLKEGDLSNSLLATFQALSSDIVGHINMEQLQCICDRVLYDRAGFTQHQRYHCRGEPTEDEQKRDFPWSAPTPTQSTPS